MSITSRRPSSRHPLGIVEKPVLARRFLYTAPPIEKSLVASIYVTASGLLPPTIKLSSMSFEDPDSLPDEWPTTTDLMIHGCTAWRRCGLITVIEVDVQKRSASGRSFVPAWHRCWRANAGL